MVEDVATTSLCPECLKVIPARRVTTGAKVWLEKMCPDHGPFSALVWEGEPCEKDWLGDFRDAAPSGIQEEEACPSACGLCGRHAKSTCTALVEVTRRCNLACPFCFADAGENPQPDPDLTTLGGWFSTLTDHSPGCTVQLSGGEPTVRDDLPTIIGTAKFEGVSFLQLNSNGLRLASEEGYAEELKDAGLDSVYLQFDGVSERTHTLLRGRPLFEIKLEAVRRCVDAELGVVLVSTLVKGVNEREAGGLVELALSLSPGVRGVHFQPVSYFGRYPGWAGAGRVTLPYLMEKLQEQTGGMLLAEHFSPPGCEHPLCSFHAKYVVLEDGGLRLLGGRERSRAPHPEERTTAELSRLWGAPEPERPATDGDELDRLLARYPRHCFTVSAMAFMDAWTVDLKRARECCVHVVSPDRGLVPFCLHNLTSKSGEPLFAPCAPQG